ncbi:MAG: hydroxymethylglutaryl-CoA lyase [Xanthobacter sp.]
MAMLPAQPALPARVRIVEVGPRDGLQNEKQLIPAAIKVELIERLQAAGLRHIETTSFVSPKWVPQMADNAQVMAGMSRREDVTYCVLVPNLRGFEAARATHPGEIEVFGSASESFSQRNINCSIEESIARFAPVVKAAVDAGIRVRGAISCALGCPYEGDISPARVAHVARLMKDIGVQHVAVADTIGTGTPRKAQAALEAALGIYELADVSGHFHDTYGQALANIYAALELGVSQFDTSVGGLGGCPYAEGATGNVATENVVYMLHGLGIETGIDLEGVIEAAAFISHHLGRPVGSQVSRAFLARCES